MCQRAIDFSLNPAEDGVRVSGVLSGRRKRRRPSCVGYGRADLPYICRQLRNEDKGQGDMISHCGAAHRALPNATAHKTAASILRDGQVRAGGHGCRVDTDGGPSAGGVIRAVGGSRADTG